MNKKLIMRYPSTWHGDMWREAAPCGNGVTGVSVYGGIKKEIILLNDAFLWKGSTTPELPDVSDALPKIRKALAENDPVSADSILSFALAEKGFDATIGAPLPLGDINIFSGSNEDFKNYRRIIDMDKALVTVSYEENGVKFARETFVSRENNLVFTRIKASEPVLDVSINVTYHDNESIGDYKIENYEMSIDNDLIKYSAYNKNEYSTGDYGAVTRVFTDGDKKITEQIGRDFAAEGGFAPVKFLTVTKTAEILLVTRTFVASDRAVEFAKPILEYNFDDELTKHTKLHTELFSKVEFSISDTQSTSNEELLLDAYGAEPSNEMMEKLYNYGRYLFVCSTAEKEALPCHLIGLWNGSYNCFWAFNMYNVNMELIYWQALTGNMPQLLRLALDYTESLMDDFRENAKKLFGCRGIFINSVNTPESGLSKCMGNHILNWTVGAAWFAQHYWDYCKYTNDIEYMKEHALPFMYETALFFEDFLFLDENGYYMFAPSVSPENTARNVIEMTKRNNIETCVNATMDIACVKELLTNLITGCEITGLYAENQEKWKDMLAKLPPYRINEDGAIKEWTHDFYKDNYQHRHHSHIYPVFPGKEVTRDHPLFENFKTAEDMRLRHGLSDQSSWSMVFMAGIAARMQEGDRALYVIETLARTCLMNNFFTVHNDWRRTGPVFCDDMRIAPFQIDGNIGIPAVINEMLLFSTDETIDILPALPKKWVEGSIKGLLAVGGIICNIAWDSEKVTVNLQAEKKFTKTIRYQNETKQLNNTKTAEVIFAFNNTNNMQ